MHCRLGGTHARGVDGWMDGSGKVASNQGTGGAAKAMAGTGGTNGPGTRHYYAFAHHRMHVWLVIKFSYSSSESFGLLCTVG